MTELDAQAKAALDNLHANIRAVNTRIEEALRPLTKLKENCNVSIYIGARDTHYNAFTEELSRREIDKERDDHDPQGKQRGYDVEVRGEP